MQENNLLKCEQCGCVDGTVVTTPDPYIEDMFNRIEEVTLCSECYVDRVRSI